MRDIFLIRRCARGFKRLIRRRISCNFVSMFRECVNNILRIVQEESKTQELGCRGGSVQEEEERGEGGGGVPSVSWGSRRGSLAPAQKNTHHKTNVFCTAEPETFTEHMFFFFFANLHRKPLQKGFLNTCTESLPTTLQVKSFGDCERKPPTRVFLNSLDRKRIRKQMVVDS